MAWLALGLAALPGCLGETVREQADESAANDFPSLQEREAGFDMPSCDGVAEGVVPPGTYDSPTGWAAQSGDGLEGTTGGAGGDVVLAQTVQELIQFARSEDPLVIQICGSIGTGFERFEIGSNKTIVGVGTRPTVRGTVDVQDVQNVVLRDFFIDGSEPDRDGLTMRRSHHVWIDHLDFADGEDGNLDITEASNYVTVSWTRFWYRDPQRAHRFSNLIGAGDNRPSDVGTLKVTMHHNWWADNVVERMPRVRYGDVHVYNNYYTSLGNNYCIRSGFEAKVLVEGNFFRGVSDPMVIDQTGDILQRDNVFDLARGRRTATDLAFEPPYAYELDAADVIPEVVSMGAGPMGTDPRLMTTEPR